MYTRIFRPEPKGEIYIGVVGPVRTGKSTFIKRFMELAVLPAMEDESLKECKQRDELPQSAAGKTVMTTEPKFIPEGGGADHFGTTGSRRKCASSTAWAIWWTGLQAMWKMGKSGW